MPKMIEISAAEYERLQDCIREDGLRIAALIEENKALQQEAAMRTVDAAPVVHGRWIPRKGKWFSYFQCSVCGEKISYPTADGKALPNYCPNCGAKMGGEGDAE